MCKKTLYPLAKRTSLSISVVSAALLGVQARAVDLGPQVITSGSFTLDGGSTVTAAPGGTAITIGNATLIFGSGNIAVNSGGTAIFSTSAASGNIVFQNGNNTTISTTSTGTSVYGIQGTSNSNTLVDLQAGSTVTLLGNSGMFLGATPAGSFNRLSIGDGATLNIRSTLGASPKGLMINTNNAASIASGGVLDVDVGAGNWSRALELSFHTTYASTDPDKLTAAAGSTVRLHTLGTEAQGIYMLGEGNIALDGTTDIHTEGNDSAGIFLYRYTSPISNFRMTPQGVGDTATVRTEGTSSYGLIAINGTQVTLDRAQFTTAGQDAFGLYATTDPAETATLIQADNVRVNTSGAGGIGIAVEGAGTRVEFNNGHVDTTGAAAHGVALAGSSGFEAKNSVIQTSGANAVGLLLFGDAASTQNVAIAGGSITSGQASAIGVDGGTAVIALNDVSVQGATNWLRVTPSGVQGATNATPVIVTDSTMDATLPPISFTPLVRGLNAAAGATVTATNSTLTGAAVTSPGMTSSVNLVNSTWNMTGNSNLTNLNNDPSLINFAAPVGGVYKTLTVNNYTGDGTIALNTYLGSDGSPSDKLVIDGGAATGSSKLRIKNNGGPGALTHGDGILVVGTVNGGITSATAFALDAPVNAGAHEYKLYRSATNPADAQNWYLRSAILVTDPETGQPEEIPLYRPETAPAVLAPEISRQLAGRMLDTFHDRMGDQYAVLSADERKAGWVRVTGQSLKQKWGGTVEPSFNGNLWVGQAGTDMLERKRDDDVSDRFGLFGSYGIATGNVDGFVDGRHGNSAGSLRMNAYGLGLYWTRLKRTDWYWDNVLMANYYSGRSRSDQGASTDMDGWGLTASTELGYSFYPRSDIMIQPQAQLFYQYTDFSNTRDQYSSIRYGAGKSSVTGRIGVLVQGNADNPDKIRPYLRVNLWRRMGHGEDVVFGDSDTVHTRYGATWAEVRAGLAAPVSQRTQLYASVGYGFELEGRQRQSYSGNIGVRYSF